MGMRREVLPVENLTLWAQFNNVTFNGVGVSNMPGNRGCGIIATAEEYEPNAILMTVPPDLVLSLETVWTYAKADRHLRQVLEAVGEYSRTARGAILITLILQLTHGATDGRIGVSSSLSGYVKYLPVQIPIPTFWDESERMMLEGTSLGAALEAKLSSLAREFSLLREKTNAIEWCRQYWWDDETGSLTFNDWKQVDAVYRSRALDLPGTGHAMVPCVDMANHASGDETTALYETDADGNAILVLRDGKKVMAGDEITITYGDEKGACEMLFSYGFIEPSMTSAKELFLDLEIPNDDPLKLAKKAVSRSAPGFRLFEREEGIGWEGSFVWLLCVNEEDGLEFKILQNTDGKQELQASWKRDEITDVSAIEKKLEKEALWDVYNLRAISTLQARVEQQLIRLERSIDDIDTSVKRRIGDSTDEYIMKLRDLEESLMLQAYEEFVSKKLQLLKSAVVQKYLGSADVQQETVPGDDFS